MEPNIKIGRLFGIEIGVNYSWFVIFVLIVYSLWKQFSTENPGWDDSTYVVVALATSVLFFLSLLAHEMSHSLLALAKGLPVKSITLFIFGGVSRIEKEAMNAATEFMVGVVGPLSSFAVGIVFLVVSRFFDRQSPIGVMCVWLWWINVWLGIFNLIPGYPMDGGRVLRAAIWAATDNVNKATRIAARIGQFFGYSMIAFGIAVVLASGQLLAGIWIAFIGFFLLEAARKSRDAAVYEHVIRGVHARDLMNAGAPVVPSNITLSEFFEDYLMRTGHRCFIVSEDGRLLGLLTPRELKAVPREHWGAIPVVRAMRPFESTRWVEPGTDLNKVIEVMEQDDANQVPVVSDGHLEGLVRREDVLRFIQTRAEFDY